MRKRQEKEELEKRRNQWVYEKDVNSKSASLGDYNNYLKFLKKLDL